ncbi:catechol oxidase [Ranunculus cassubicifolius]
MSLSFLATTTPITNTTVTNPNLNQRSLKPPTSIAPNLIRKRYSSASCSQKQQEGGVDRRDVLVGLGGLCGAATVLPNVATGVPVQPPDLSACHLADDDQLADGVQCCPPYGSSPVVITDFKLPDASEPLRVRQSTQALAGDKKNLEKFMEAIKLMRELPADDPWNFMQQAQIHCAYCNGAYSQVGFPSVSLQLHGSWLFPPWHRYYIYFWEKILGKLIGDDTLAIPYWNYDQPEGMRFPEIYNKNFPRNPLYNCNRNSEHVTGALMSYRYEIGDPNPTPAEEADVILANQKQLHDMYAENLFTPANFMGQPILAGQTLNGPGVLETLHNTPHKWCGLTEKPRWDMGNFHTAARDTIFFGHHAEVDRLWSIYKDQRGTNKPEFETPDWLEASFIFYDENKNIVNCKVKDCLDPSALRYTYQKEEKTWLNIRRTYFKKKKAKPRSASAEELVAVEKFGSSPRLLDTTIRALVTRPQVSRSKDDKEEESEVIFIDDFTFNETDSAGFDVYITKPTEGLVTADLGEFAGAFVHIPHGHGGQGHKNVLRLGITYLLEDIEAEGSEQLVVSLVPRSGDVTIAGISIQLVPRQEI